MAGVLGKLLGVDQEKAIESLPGVVREVLGNMTLEEFVEKFGSEHQLGFDITIEGGKVKVKVQMEDRPKEENT